MCAHSRWGRSGEVIVDLIKEWGLADATVGISHVDPVYGHHLPVDEWERLRDGLPEATLERVGDFFHELVHVKSAEEIECVRKAGKLMDQAFHAMIAAARPGVTEYQLAAADHPRSHGWWRSDGFQHHWMRRRWTVPAMVFGNPWPSSRPLEAGDIILNELACGYNGYSVQIGGPICIGEPPSWIREFFDDVVLPGYDLMAEQVIGGNSWDDVMKASQFYRDKGYDSRPLFLHCIDFVSHPPHVMWDHVVAEDNELDLRGRDRSDAGADDHHTGWVARDLLRANLCPHRRRARTGDQVPPRVDRHLSRRSSTTSRSTPTRSNVSPDGHRASFSASQRNVAGAQWSKYLNAQWPPSE